MRAILVGCIIVAMTLVIIGIILPDGNIEDKKIFSVTLADPTLYQDGVYLNSMEITNGTYQFKFIPNGDSPQNLSIKLSGDSFSLYKDFKLEATAHESDSALYYTWNYLGNKEFIISETQNVDIEINPNGDTLGPVSVQIIRK